MVENWQNKTKNSNLNEAKLNNLTDQNETESHHSYDNNILRHSHLLHYWTAFIGQLQLNWIEMKIWSKLFNV